MQNYNNRGYNKPKPQEQPFSYKTFDELDNINLVEEAQNVANNIVKDRQGVTKSLVRRFYQEYVSIVANKDDFDDKNENLLRIKMLIPKAEYSFARNTKGEKFIIWFRANLKKINSYEDAKKFMTYFEAFLGFFYSNIKGE